MNIYKYFQHILRNILNNYKNSQACNVTHNFF